MSELTLSTITVSGEDAFDFLQNQLTADLRACHSTGDSDPSQAESPEILSAWCSPKGRVIWFGTVQKADSGFALSAPAETAQDIVDRLTVFRFRARVEFAVEENTGMVDPAFLIHNGYAFIGRDQVEEFTPHMLNLDLIGAVSLDKGCYPGQEIVARTHYRGKTKRRLFRFESDGPVSPGGKISDGSRDVGEVVNAAGNDLLAVVPIDKVSADLTVGGVALVNSALPYPIE
jgi:folate-binding protein YgfZ